MTMKMKYKSACDIYIDKSHVWRHGGDWRGGRRRHGVAAAAAMAAGGMAGVEWLRKHYVQQQRCLFILRFAFQQRLSSAFSAAGAGFI